MKLFWRKVMFSLKEMGQRLESERKRLDFKAVDIYANADINIAQTTYKNYETGKRDIPSSLLEKLWHMGFDVQYVVTGEYSLDGGAVPSREELNKKYGYEPPTIDIAASIKTVIRLIELKETMNLDNPADQLLTCMYHAEETLIQAGAKSGEDYSYKDLLVAGTAMLERVFPERTGNNKKADD